MSRIDRFRDAERAEHIPWRHRGPVPLICDICGEWAYDEMLNVGQRLDVHECEDGLYRCDVCIEDYRREQEEEEADNAYLN